MAQLLEPLQEHGVFLAVEDGLVCLHAIVDCCTRELVAWTLDLRGRVRRRACVENAVLERHIRPGTDESNMVLGLKSVQDFEPAFSVTMIGEPDYLKSESEELRTAFRETACDLLVETIDEWGSLARVCGVVGATVEGVSPACQR